MSADTQIAVLEEKTSRQESLMDEVHRTLSEVTKLQLKNEHSIDKFVENTTRELEECKKKVGELHSELNNVNEKVAALDAFKRQIKRDVKISGFLICGAFNVAVFLTKYLPT